MDAMTQFFENVGRLADLAGLISFVGLIWTVINVHILRTEQREGNKKIVLLLEVEGQPSRSYTIPGTISRKDFSRAEIMGRLGMIPRKNNTSNFNIKYVQKNPKFLEKIERIYDAKKDMIMTVFCSPEEFDQFDFE